MLDDGGVPGPLLGVPPDLPIFDMHPVGVTFDDAGDVIAGIFATRSGQLGKIGFEVVDDLKKILRLE